MYYKSNQYKNLFDRFPVIVIIGNTTGKITENKNINYQWLEYEKVKEWDYRY